MLQTQLYDTTTLSSCIHFVIAHTCTLYLTYCSLNQAMLLLRMDDDTCICVLWIKSTTLQPNQLLNTERCLFAPTDEDRWTPSSTTTPTTTYLYHHGPNDRSNHLTDLPTVICWTVFDFIHKPLLYFVVHAFYASLTRHDFQLVEDKVELCILYYIKMLTRGELNSITMNAFTSFSYIAG